MRWVMATGFVVAWSSGFVGAALAQTTGVGLWALLTWRYLVTALLLVATCLAAPSARRAIASLRRRDLGQQGMLALLSHVVFLGGVFLAAERGLDAGLSAMICALQPMLVATVGCILFRERLRLRQWGGMGLALVGVALSVGSVGASGMGSAGLVVASLAGLSTAAILERAWQPAVPVMVSMAIQTVIAVLVFTVIATFTGGFALSVSATLVASVSWLVLLSGLAGYATFTWCLRRIGATATSVLLYLTAPVTMLWGWAMFGQQPTSLRWAGLVIVLGGVALAMRSGQSTGTGQQASRPFSDPHRRPSHVR